MGSHTQCLQGIGDFLPLRGWNLLFSSAQDCKVFPLLKKSQKSNFVCEISQCVNTSSKMFLNCGLFGLGSPRPASSEWGCNISRKIQKL